MRSIRHLGDRSGASAVEFAILSPIFVMMIFGIISAGLLFGVSQATQQLAADTARYSLAGIDAAERQRLARSYVEASKGRYFLLGDRSLNVTVMEREGQLSVDLALDVSNLPLWVPFVGRLLPDGTIHRNAVTYVGRTS